MIIALVTWGAEVHQYCLVAGAHTMGRRGCAIVLPTHVSISRHHATLTVLPTPASELENVTFRPLVLLADVSKHGTFVNGELLSNNDAHRSISESDVVTFGTAATLRVQHFPVVIWKSPRCPQSVINDVATLGGICVTSPAMPMSISGASLSPYGLFCPTDIVEFTPQWLLAILAGYVFVNSKFLPALRCALRESPGTQISCLPDPATYDVPLPSQLEAIYQRPPLPYFLPRQWSTDASRTAAVFRSRHFIIVQDWTDVAYADVVAAGEGTSTVLTVGALVSFQPTMSNASSLPLLGLVPDEHAHALNCVLVLPEVLYDNFVDGASTDHWPEQFECTVRGLWDAGCTFIRLENIASAVVSANPAACLIPPVDGAVSKQSLALRPHSESDADSDATVDGLSAFRFRSITTKVYQPVLLTSAAHSGPQQKGAARAPRVVKDLYREWQRYREVQYSADASETTPRSRKGREPEDFALAFRRKLPVLRQRVVKIADRVMDTGSLSRADASYLNTVHQRVVNYIDWVKNQNAHADETLAYGLLQCIETTVLTANQLA